MYLRRTIIVSPKKESESGIAAVDRKKMFSVGNIHQNKKKQKSMTLHDHTLPQTVLPVVTYVISSFASLIICLFFFIKEHG